MRDFWFRHASLYTHSEHRRLDLEQASLRVVVHDVPELPAGVSRSELIGGKYEVTGTIALSCPASQNPLRPGMAGILRVRVPERNATARLPVLVVGMTKVESVGQGQRRYTWEVLGIARPGFDSLGLLPKPADEPLTLPAGEIDFQELIYQLGGQDTAGPAVRWDAEGGFRM